VFERLPDGTFVTPRHHIVETRTVGAVTLDAYRFHIGLRWLRWPFWERELAEAAAIHDYLYETAETSDEHRSADQAFVEVAAQHQTHPLKLLLAWTALRTWAFARVRFGVR